MSPQNGNAADPVGMGRKSRQYTIFQYSVLARLSVHSDWISCMYLAQYPCLPFWGLIYVQLMHLWAEQLYNRPNIFSV